ncbi:MAG: proprotein convertase P-domain-containing protein, partial [Myxococcales bacterium]|nr:proprotein convertase P-domain-containing protein [Myxococcales bacterium]
ADMDGDGVPDVALGADEPPNRLDCIRTLLWRLPAPVGVLQALTEPFEPVPVHPAAPVERAIATAGQWLDRVVVRVRLEGSAIGNATLALTAPDGTALPLAPVVGAGAAVVQVVERPDANANRALAALAGRWMPAGAWTLTVTNNGAEDFDLVDFTVVTHGQFTRAAP